MIISNDILISLSLFFQCKNNGKASKRTVISLAKRNDNDILINNPDTLFRYTVDMLVVTAALVITGTYINGFNALRTSFWAVLTSVLIEDITCRIMKRKDRRTHNMYAAATGLAIAVMLPATTPAYIVFIASAFAVMAVLVPFGSARKVPFVPAAAGICFVTVCFPEAVFSYSPVNIGVSSPIYGTENFVSALSYSKMLTYGQSVFHNSLEHLSVLVGKVPGPMGTTCILVLIACAVYLLFQRKDNFLISLSFFAACTAYAAFFPRVNSTATTSVTMELSAGVLIFAGLILLPQPYTAPSTKPGKITYGFMAGIICMLLRRYGAYEESACFTVLIMNAVGPAVGDYYDIVLGILREKGLIKEKTKKIRFAEPKPKKEKVKKEKPEKIKKEKAKKEKVKKEKPAKIKKEKNKENNIAEKTPVTQETAEENIASSVLETKSYDDIPSYDDLMKFDDDYIDKFILGNSQEKEETENG